MVKTHSERLACKTGVASGRANTEPAAHRASQPRTRVTTVPGGSRNPNPGKDQPHAKHPDEQEGVGEEQASSLHPSREPAGSSQSRVTATPSAALLMAAELLRYHPAQASLDPWLARVTELITAAATTPHHGLASSC